MAKADEIIQLSKKKMESLVNHAADTAVAKYEKNLKYFATKDDLNRILTTDLPKVLDKRFVTKDTFMDELH